MPTELERSAYEALKTNRRESDGYQYTIPSENHYPYQWLWDSCFHTIVLARIEPDAAKKEIIALLSKQFANGMVPHIIYWSPGILHLFRWGTEGTSSLTQPPMLAYAVWEIHRHAPDKAFLEQVYPSLEAYYRFLIDRRDPFTQHLIGIINPDESGEDNSPRFDVPLKVRSNVSHKTHLEKRHELVDANRESNFDTAFCMRNYFGVNDVLFNIILVENLKVLAQIASLLGHEDGKRFASEQAGLIENAMREHMFEDGVYWSTMSVDNKKLKVATWTHFLPLFAGLYSDEEAKRVVQTHLLNEKTFRAPYGVRTVSKQERSYRAEGYGNFFSWRGPVWISAHWFIYRGLLRYGFSDEAADIRNKSLELLQRSGFRECFNSETGEGQGAHKFTWGALVLDMMES